MRLMTWILICIIESWRQYCEPNCSLVISTSEHGPPILTSLMQGRNVFIQRNSRRHHVQPSTLSSLTCFASINASQSEEVVGRSPI
jgi:hypothetical protein